MPEHLELTFDVLLHSASLIAILVAFRQDIMDALRRGPNFWLIIAIGVVPTGIAGLFMRDVVESASKQWALIGVAYLFTTFMLISSQIANRRQEARGETSDDPATITVKQAGFVGLMQITCLF
ncbi:MAG: undecaprenyl-diphosphate phosphatase, partial [Planctomycetota bacterium]